jgi:hypothetical protein
MGDRGLAALLAASGSDCSKMGKGERGEISYFTGYLGFVPLVTRSYQSR